MTLSEVASRKASKSPLHRAESRKCDSTEYLRLSFASITHTITLSYGSLP